MKDKNYHKLILRIPKRMHEHLKDFKEYTGISITSQIQNAIVTWLFLKKKISLDELKNIKKVKKKND